MGYPADTKNVVYLFGIYTLIVSFSAVFKVTFRAFEKMEYEAGITILANIIRISLGLLVLFLGYGLVELALVFLFSGVFDFLLSFLICGRRFVKPKLELDLDFWKSTIKVAFPLSITGISILIYTRVDTVMLSLMDGDAAVGWYNAAYNLILGVKPLPKIIMTVLFPLMSSYFVSSKDSLRSLWKRSLKYFLIIALPASTGIALLADKIILLCYGEQFYPSIIALRILAWDVLLFVLWQSSTFVLISANKQKLWSFIAIITATVNIFFNLILIPYLSYVGAAIATIIAEGVCVALLFYFTCSLFKEIPDYKYLIKPLIASLFMGLFIHLLNPLNVLILIISSASLYFVALYFLKTFSDEDIYIFKRMVKK
jgi:O-antigen/teichoic acid export membrane protein